MVNVIVIRPGCTDFDEQQRIQGSLDLPLNSRGRKQVDHLAEQLAGAEIEILFTAPGEPARSTAAAIGESLGIAVKEKEGLRNLDQGLWEGMTLDDIRRKFPKVFKQWQESPETICPPDGETIPEALERIRAALLKPLRRRSAFGVVVSEPMASLVGSFVSGRKPEMAHPFCGCAAPPEVKQFQTNGRMGNSPTNEALE